MTVDRDTYKTLYENAPKIEWNGITSSGWYNCKLFINISNKVIIYFQNENQTYFYLFRDDWYTDIQFDGLNQERGVYRLSHSNKCNINISWNDYGDRYSCNIYVDSGRFQFSPVSGSIRIRYV